MDARDGTTRASFKVSSSFTLAVAIDCRNDPRDADELRRRPASGPAPAARIGVYMHIYIHTYNPVANRICRTCRLCSLARDGSEQVAADVVGVRVQALHRQLHGLDEPRVPGELSGLRKECTGRLA